MKANYRIESRGKGFALVETSTRNAIAMRTTKAELLAYASRALGISASDIEGGKA